MSFGDKIKNKAQEASGKVKEKVGDATNNEDLQGEGLAVDVVVRHERADR